MKNGISGALVAWIGSTSLALAQAPGPLGPLTEPAQAWLEDGGSASNGRSWAGAEYLLWWIKDTPLPAPFVTTGPVSANPGALSAGGVPFLTNDQVAFGGFSGVRVTAGAWLDMENQLGVEVNGFFLPARVETRAARSDANGNPTLALRYVDVPGEGPGENAFPASIPGMRAGTVAAVSQSRLWGTEANGVLGLAGDGELKLQMLAGFRYFDLDESLGLHFTSTAIDGGTVFFEGAALGAPNTVAALDQFHTRNQFYAGQVGIRGEYSFGKLLVSGTGKVALGSNHEVEEVTGISALLPPAGAPTIVAGGQFAGPSSIVRRSRNECAVLPEVDFRLRYQLTGALRVSVGYDALYWNRVVRPGDQVNLQVDGHSNPLSGAFIPGTRAALSTGPFFSNSDFWVEGLTLGLEWRF